MCLSYDGVPPAAADELCCEKGQGEPADLEKLTRFMEDDYNGNRVLIDCTSSQASPLSFCPAHPSLTLSPSSSPLPPHPSATLVLHAQA